MWFVLIVVIVGTLVALAGYGWRGGDPNNEARQYIQGEQPLQAAPQAGDPGGPAPANEEQDPLAR